MSVTEASAPQLTLLWGTWELWCDLPAQVTAAPNADTTRNNNSNNTNTHIGESENWLNQVRSIGLFDSAEGFWGAHICTVPPSRLPPNSSYYLFRKNIAPMWEHEANRRGGKWVITFTVPSSAVSEDSQANNADVESLQPVDMAWQKLCLAAIGELFPCDEEEVCGLTVSRSRSRPGKAAGAGVEEWKVCVWTRTADDEDAQMSVARFLGDLLGPQRSDDTLDAANMSNLSMSGGSPGKAVTTPLRLKPLNASMDGLTPTTVLKTRVESTSAMKLSISYLAHRELMEVKQRRHTKGAGGPAFGPKYTYAC